MCTENNVPLLSSGDVHEVRHAREGGVREGLTVCDRGGDQDSRACDGFFQKMFIYMKPEILI